VTSGQTDDRADRVAFVQDGFAARLPRRARLGVADHEEITRVWIRVEKAVLEHFGQDEAHAVLRDAVAIQSRRVERGEVVDLDAADLFHRQHARRCELPVHFRDVDRGVVRKVAADTVGILPLARVIQFVAQRVGEFFDETHGIVRFDQLGAARREMRQVGEYFQVALDQGFDMRALHLDDDARAVFQLCRVRLTDGRGRAGDAFELGKDLFGRRAEFVLNHTRHRVIRHRRRGVLQF